jgi:DNA mismatch endonuclease, patch repair protein
MPRNEMSRVGRSLKRISGERHPILTDADTSTRMARIRQKGTIPELVVRKTLRTLGIGYRLNVRSLPGSPDLANKLRKLAVFVQGCYWHHHTQCKRATMPKRNGIFWEQKFIENRHRDARAIRELRRLGYTVVVVWECETINVTSLRTRLLLVATRRHRKRSFNYAVLCRAGPSNPPESSNARCTL